VRKLLLVGLLPLALAGCGGGGGEATDLPLGKKVAAVSQLDPTVHVFAEPVTATLEVVVDGEQLDPDRVRVETSFLPYDVKAERQTTEKRGQLTVIRREVVLRCLRIACIPEVLASDAGPAETGRGERRTLKLPAARVLYEDPDGTTRLLQKKAWPEVVSVSRLKESDVPGFARFLFKTGVTPLAEPDYRVSPTLLGVGLLVVALALLALPAALVILWLRRRRPAPVLVEEPQLTPLECALRLVEWSRGRENGSERREALEVLAVELEAVERPELARSARELAWSATVPSPERASSLVSEVRSSDGLA
jgi:hypothetical protein